MKNINYFRDNPSISTWVYNHFAGMSLMFSEFRETWKVYGGNDAGRTCGIRSLRPC